MAKLSWLKEFIGADLNQHECWLRSGQLVIEEICNKTYNPDNADCQICSPPWQVGGVQKGEEMEKIKEEKNLPPAPPDGGENGGCIPEKKRRGRKPGVKYNKRVEASPDQPQSGVVSSAIEGNEPFKTILIVRVPEGAHVKTVTATVEFAD